MYATPLIENFVRAEPHPTEVEWAVLVVLIEALGYDDCAPITITKLARRAGRDRATVHRALHRLIEKGIVCRDDDDRSCLWINSNYATKGALSRARCCTSRR